MRKKITTSYIYLAAIALALMLWGYSTAETKAQQALEKLNVPEGFSIEVYADDVPNARQMAFGGEGILYVGSRQAGKVYAVIDHNGDFKADTVYTVAKDLRLPSGVAFKDGALYVGAVNRILRYDNINDQLEDPTVTVVVTEAYPTDGHHGWKFIAIATER